MPEVSFSVDGYPLAEAEALSMLGSGHPHQVRVRALLEAAVTAVAGGEFSALLTERLGLELVLYAPADPPSDATNYLGGVGDVLEVKGHRGSRGSVHEVCHRDTYEARRERERTRDTERQIDF
jgi:hypothetical protein